MASLGYGKGTGEWNISCCVCQTAPFCIGHSIVASPWGTVLKEVGEREVSFIIELDRKKIEKARKLIPILTLLKPEL